MTGESITVITLTRYRPELVQRAMRSVRAQRISIPVNHMVLIDDSPETLSALTKVAPDYPHCTIRCEPRNDHEKSGPGRSSLLRNLGVQLSSDSWIAYLDDDNEWAADHLAYLVECTHSCGVRAAYSDVSVLNTDGTPYLEPRWPWASSNAQAEEMYQYFLAKGICVAGSNVIRSQPGDIDAPVDTSAWLLARELLLEVPFKERFSSRDASDLVGEDDKLFCSLVEKGEPMAGTGQPTLKYYLGGYSNSAQTVDPREKIFWASE